MGCQSAALGRPAEHERQARTAGEASAQPVDAGCGCRVRTQGVDALTSRRLSQGSLGCSLYGLTDCIQIHMLLVRLAFGAQAVAETCGSYVAETCDSYVAETCDSYVAETCGSYVAETCGSYVAETCGSYVAETCSSYVVTPVIASERFGLVCMRVAAHVCAWDR
eukprot:355239-Chlamydomonas_euryale.AAC.5